MKIVFAIGWAGGREPGKSFKSAGARELFADYSTRVSRFAPCSVVALPDAPKRGAALWLCDSGGRAASSEELAKKLAEAERMTSELRICIGPADGFSKEDRERLKPNWIWSFGPMTLPHELAAAVAAEQVYRAFTILRGLPYHSGHAAR